MSTRKHLDEIDALPPPDPDDEVVRLHMALDAIEPGLAEYYVMIEAENRALREYYARAERFYRANADAEYRSCPDAGEWLIAENEWRDQAERLAAEHGMPLPGAGEGSDETR